MSDEASSLRSRWQTHAGATKAVKVIKTLQDKQGLQKLSFLERHNDRWDLRGLILPPLKRTGYLPLGSQVVETVQGLTKFRGIRLVDIDLSYATLQDSAWAKSKLENVLLNYANADQIGFWACHLSDIEFRYASLNHACLGGNMGRVASSFANVDFSHAHLQGTTHGFASYEGCDLSYADLDDVDFDGARLVSCKFAGLIKDLRFRAHSRMPSLPLFPWQKVDTMRFTNLMEDVDFSKADLRGVNFDGVDLSRCKFAEDDYILVIRNQYEVLSKARNIIAHEWAEDDVKHILYLLDQFYLIDSKKSQPIQIINRKDLIDFFGHRTGEKVFSLFGKLSTTAVV